MARIRAALGNKFKVLLEEGVSLPTNVSGAITWQQANPDSFNKALMALFDELTTQGITGAQE